MKNVKVPDGAKERFAEEIIETFIELIRKYEVVVNNSPIFIGIIDKNGVFVQANPSMIKSIGENPVGKSLFDLFSPDVADRRMKFVREVIEKGEALIDQDERDFRHFLVHYYPITLKKQRYCLVMSTEITEVVRVKRLLSVLNKINTLILRERDIKTLIECICGELYAIQEFCGVKIEVFSSDGKNSGLSIVKGDIKACKHYRIELSVDGKSKGVLEIYSERPLDGEELSLLEAMANDLAFRVKLTEMYNQIKRDMEYFAFLVDRIRNPLTTIQLLTEMNVEDDSLRESLLHQVRRIVDIVSHLDEGWLQSREYFKNV